MSDEYVIVTDKLTKFFGKQNVVYLLDLRVLGAWCTAFSDLTAPERLPP